MNTIHAEVLIIGSGIAGLYTAIKLSETAEVTVVTKSHVHVTNSSRAQGGIAVPLSEEDSPQSHYEDTLNCGLHLNDLQAVQLLTSKSRLVYEDLLSLGIQFDRNVDQTVALAKEGFHSQSRIVHAGGDTTGKIVMQALIEAVHHNPRITIFEQAFVEDLVIDQNGCHGAIVFYEQQHVVIGAKAVVLANGGAGQIYAETTNVLPSTGDGYALAKRAGALLKDMEFIQFHPTALATDEQPKCLISEAVRGEGARLVNEQGYHFMNKYHAWEDLAPRDIVSRAIFQEMQAGQRIFLDATNIGDRFEARFPSIYASCAARGIDPVREWIPVTPAAHFVMGGIHTNLNGETTVQRLYACGETACTGVHGANRLASNSLLEGLVFGAQIAQTVTQTLAKNKKLDRNRGAVRTLQLGAAVEPRYDPDVYRWTVQQVLEYPDVCTLRQEMWKHAGIVRTDEGLRDVLAQIHLWLQGESWHPIWENLCMTSAVVVQSALARKESRGAHFRKDFPQMSQEWASRRTTWRQRDEQHLVK